MEFLNAQQTIDQLPSIEEVQFIGLPKAHLRAGLISYSIFFLIIAAIISLVYLLSNELHLEIYIGILLLIGVVTITVLVLTALGFKHKAYALRDQDILYKSGLIWRDTTIVPFNRIQHVEIGEGPIERMFGLASLRVFTAGGSKSDLVVPGLNKPDAQTIKGFLAEKISRHE